MTKPLGDLLVERGVVDEATLREASAVGERQGLSVGKALVQLGATTERDIVAVVAAEIGLPFADTAPGAVDPDAAALMPRAEARELLALPVAFEGAQTLLVAVADPNSSTALERVRELTGLQVRPALAVRTELLAAIDHLADAGADGVVAADNGRGPQAGTDAAAAGPSRGAADLLASETTPEIDLAEVLAELLERDGSDLHLTAGMPPTIRLHGELVPLEQYPVLTPDELQKIVYGMLTQRRRETFENELELDFSYTLPGRARFRVNVFQQRSSLGAVLRVIPAEILSIEDLGLPPQIERFSRTPRGFVLVTGPTGSGKSTTLASLIDLVNRERAGHVMTVEDPIEFLHRHKRSIVNQRELGTDTWSFSAALKHCLRQDPDVILVGELRDLETIQVALTAAETGHLVFGTLHTQDAPQTVDRMIDVFPPHQQEQIRIMLASALQGVVCQQLLKTADGKGRVAATEVLFATPAIRNLIREGKTHQMYSALQAGKEHGMVTMDQSLATHVLAGRITYEAALERCNNPADFNRLCGRS